MSADTRGDTVFRGIAWSAFACSANTACVDVKDGRVLRELGRSTPAEILEALEEAR